MSDWTMIQESKQHSMSIQHHLMVFHLHDLSINIIFPLWATDKAIGKILEACKKGGYILFITADHGNAEEMKFPDGKPKTSHTTNKVPFIMAKPF
ncbi:hypothetical protein CDV36_008630 [Fusarium kuroshium]|uniref:Metalloenzyme domain-containing protein n=1 Tax=Fusarium kuroshium TaxID=2010991 RepID=A0A3M2S2G4_9HYPO|nr:hypothetical protein CDV36_008630 [Fusarium kuroshium]